MYVPAKKELPNQITPTGIRTIAQQPIALQIHLQVLDKCDECYSLHHSLSSRPPSPFGCKTFYFVTFPSLFDPSHKGKDSSYFLYLGHSLIFITQQNLQSAYVPKNTAAGPQILQSFFTSSNFQSWQHLSKSPFQPL